MTIEFVKTGRPVDKGSMTLLGFGPFAGCYCPDDQLDAYTKWALTEEAPPAPSDDDQSGAASVEKRLTAATETGDEVAAAGLRARLEWMSTTDIEGRRAEIIESNLDEDEKHRQLAELDEDVIRKQENHPMNDVDQTIADRQAELAKRGMQKARTINQANALMDELVKAERRNGEAVHDTHHRLMSDGHAKYCELYNVIADAQSAA